MNILEEISEGFLGVWRCDGDESNARVEITKCDEGFRLRVFDVSDGEEFKVEIISYGFKTIEFTALVPSNKYKTKNRSTLGKSGYVNYELTIYETWVK